MAETRRSTALAFDGIYGNLAQLGLPLPLVAILSMKNLTLESAMWSARCSASGFSVTLFWPFEGVNTKNIKNPMKRRRARKRSKGLVQTFPYQTTNDRVNASVGVETVGKDRPATPVRAPSVPVLPPDTPFRAGASVPDEPMDDGEELAVLDTVIHVEFQLTEESGPALRYTTKKGVALTPIRMPSLSEDSEDCPDATRKYLESCKSVEYVRVDGKPGLTVHQGRCCFWTAIELTPEVVGTRPD